MPIVELLTSLDLSVLHWFNVDLSHPWLDQFWLVFTRLHKVRAVQFGLAPVVLGLGYRKWGLEIWKPVVMVALSVALCDALSYRVIKARVNRPRPFDNPAISSWLRPVGTARGASFPSNHAANCFAAAGVLAWYFARQRQWFYLFAAMVGISRLTLGVHYPSDVLAGAVIGSCVAFLVNTMIISHVRELWISTGDTAQTTSMRSTFKPDRRA